MACEKFVLIRIEVFVLVGAVILLLLLVLGSFRRRSRSKIVNIIIWVAYTISLPLVTYTTGLMESSTCGNDLFAVWAISLYIVLGSVDSISAYSLQDNENWKIFEVQMLVQSFWIGWLIGTYLTDRQLKAPIWILFILTILSGDNRTACFRLASKSDLLTSNTKWIADYMEKEHNLSPESNASDMNGYLYVVDGESEERPKTEPPDYLIQLDTDDTNLITVERIFGLKGGNLLTPSGDPEGRLKDVCLSFALSKLLMRRFCGYRLAEAPLQKTHDFVFQGLISENDGERAFRVIEVELSFIYDYFYTKYPLIFHHKHFVIISFLMIFPSSWLAVLLFKHYQNPNDDLTYHKGHGKDYDALITFIVVVAIALLEFLQVFLYIASDWFKVILVSRYVANSRWQGSARLEKSISLLGKLRIFKPWQNKLGQYLFLDSFNYTSKNVMHMLSSGLIDKTRQGLKQQKPIELSSQVKKAIIASLTTKHGNLTNGITLSPLHVSEQLSWACKFKTIAHSILVWHIATSLCESSSKLEEKGDQDTCKQVATTLSRYCAYLVAFMPKLLPGHFYDTEFLFDVIVSEARTILKGCKTENEIMEKMRNLADGPGEEIVVKGARLWKQLREGKLENQNVRWKLLAEFWTEMMIYVAPSDNATTHLENIARGGEFITHLWALLTHAGILEQQPCAESQVV